MYETNFLLQLLQGLVHVFMWRNVFVPLKASSNGKYGKVTAFT